MGSVVKGWLKKLKSKGIITYQFNKLPEELKNLSAHRRAISDGLVEKVGKGIHSSIWRIKLNINITKIKNKYRIRRNKYGNKDK